MLWQPALQQLHATQINRRLIHIADRQFCFTSLILAKYGYGSYLFDALCGNGFLYIIPRILQAAGLLLCMVKDIIKISIYLKRFFKRAIHKRIGNGKNHNRHQKGKQDSKSQKRRILRAKGVFE